MLPAPLSRVLLTCDCVGGVWTYAVDLARGLNQYGTRIALASLGSLPRAEQIAELSGLDGVELHSRECRLEWMEEPWADVDAAGEWLQDLARDFSAEVVHLNGFAHGVLGWSVPVMVVAHSCVLSWWQAVHGRDAPAAYDEYRRRVRRGLDGADLVIAPTEAMLRSLRACYGWNGSGEVVPNGRFQPISLRKEKKPWILSVGRVWDEAKGMKLLEQVAGDLPWPVLLAGEATFDGQVVDSFRRARTLGRLPAGEVRTYLEAAAIYAAPVRYEPFGLAILEAAAAGCALVLSDLPSLRETWDGAAQFVPPGAPEEWIATLLALIEDGPARARWGDLARQRARNLGGLPMVQAYTRRYRSLLQSRKREAPAYS